MLLVANVDFENLLKNTITGHETTKIVFFFEKPLRSGSTITLKSVQWAYGPPADSPAYTSGDFTTANLRPYIDELDICYMVKLRFPDFSSHTLHTKTESNLSETNIPNDKTLLFAATTFFVIDDPRNYHILGGGVHDTNVVLGALSENRYMFSIDVELLGFHPDDGVTKGVGSIMNALTLMLEVHDSHQIGSS